MKSFKNLFIKEDDEQEPPPGGEKHAFPVGENAGTAQSSSPRPSANPFLEEVMEVYEKGLQSINMPGYDFFDFYNTIQAAGAQNESVYKMALQMGKTMDANITATKLVSDAEYYISKINEVHQSYSEQGNRKLESLDAQVRSDKDKLLKEAERLEADINRMKQQILALEKSLADARNNLGKADETHKPEQESIRLKLAANDQAMQLCTRKLNTVKDSIVKYLK